MKFVFFDIDGVLLQPAGYRKAVRDTLQSLADQAQIETQPMDEEIPALFESYGITSEWDMLAISFAILLEFYCRITGKQVPGQTVEAVLSGLANGEPVSIQPDYRRDIVTLAEIARLEETPSLSIFHHLRDSDFPALGRQAILADIFCHTRSVNKSYITRLFQNLVLGDDLFTKTYGRPVVHPTQSYLETYDVSLLNETNQQWIKSAIAQHSHYFAGLTARPSLGPHGYADPELTAYSPEAELALRVIGLEEMHLLGYGRLQFEASKMGIDADALLKPDPYHTIAAIYACIYDDEQKGLEMASKILRHSHGTIDFSELTKPMELVIFEDSPGGILSVQSAARLLQDNGIPVNTIVYGVTDNPDKMKSLEKIGAKLFPNVNDALQNYLTKV